MRKDTIAMSSDASNSSAAPAHSAPAARRRPQSPPRQPRRPPAARQRRVLAKGRSQVPFLIDEHPGGALGPCCAYPSRRDSLPAASAAESFLFQGPRW